MIWKLFNYQPQNGSEEFFHCSQRVFPPRFSSEMAVEGGQLFFFFLSLAGIPREPALPGALTSFPRPGDVEWAQVDHRAFRVLVPSIPTCLPGILHLLSDWSDCINTLLTMTVIGFSQCDTNGSKPERDSVGRFCAKILRVYVCLTV